MQAGPGGAAAGPALPTPSGPPPPQPLEHSPSPPFVESHPFLIPFLLLWGFRLEYVDTHLLPGVKGQGRRETDVLTQNSKSDLGHL